MSKILIVGGGVAGLSAGIYALKAGYEVTIMEIAPRAGGLLSSWDREGYNVENCLFKGLDGCLEGSEMRKIFETIGLIRKDEEFFHPSYLYSSTTGETTIYAYKDLKKLEQELLQFSPADKRPIKEMIFGITELMKVKKDYKNPPPFTRFAKRFKKPLYLQDYLLRQQFWGRESVEEWAKSFSSKAIQNFLLDLLTPEVSRFYYLLAYADFVKGDTRFPKATSVELANRVKDKFLSLGGVLKLDCPLTKIQIDMAYIRSLYSFSQEFTADKVIFAIDPFALVPSILDKECFDKKIVERFENKEDYTAYSSLQFAYLIDEKEAFEDLSFKELPTPLDLGGVKADRAFMKCFQDYPSSVKEGKTVLQVRFRVRRDIAESWINALPEDYRKPKETLEKALEEDLLKMGLHPLHLLDFSTPKSYKRYGYSPLGSYFSFFVGPKGDSYPIPNKIKSFNNAYMATQWLISPGGVGAASLEGKYAVQAILKDDKKDTSI